MRNEIRIVGSGGQGVILSSIILSQAIGIYENMEIAQTQSYGPEARGGACKSEIVVSDRAIDYMKVDLADIFIAFNDVGFRKYISGVAPEALIVINSTLVEPEEYNIDNLFSVPATELAEKNLKPVVTNIVMLGALAKLSNIVSFDNLAKGIEDMIPPNFHQLNRDALGLGYKNVTRGSKNELL